MSITNRMRILLVLERPIIGEALRRAQWREIPRCEPDDDNRRGREDAVKSCGV